MSKHDTEADARILIDTLLRQAGWDPADKSQVRTEVSVSGASKLNDAPPGLAPSQEMDSRRTDYILLAQNGRPLAVTEAKRGRIDPYTAKEQVLPMAKYIGAPFIFLSNGELTYFWDHQNDDARIVSSFYSRRDLERLLYLRKEAKPLATIPIPDDFIRVGEARIVRPYQKEVLRALDHAVELGKRRFLIELPTGTGKTDTICLHSKRMFKAGRAERLLFLVDREQLAEQAIGALQDLCPEYSSYWLKPGMAIQHKQITVCLLQTMIGRYHEFTAGYYDIVIADECHRSIYGAWQAALTYFDAFHIGLTATPAAYIDRNTYQFYQCKTGQPDFAFSMAKAIQDGHLVPYRFATRITQLIADGTTVNGETFDPAEFERTWTNEDTNRKMMQEFDRLAWESCKDLAPKQKDAPGKAIVFALTKHHAARLAYYLNQLHPEHDGRYAEVITSDIPDADAAIRRFKKDAYPMVAVSVDMLTTGFDCREVLHIVLCRRILSPILYQQIRGRGTRSAPHIGKKMFVIYDFFRNHEYFNDTETDIFEGPVGGVSSGGGKRPPGERTELVELGIQDDWLDSLTYVEVGPTGERVDKKAYVTNWEDTIKQAVADDPVIQKVRDGEPLTDAEEHALAEKLNRPESYFNEDNLRAAYRRAGGNLIEFVRHALGLEKLKSKDEEVTENFHAWLVSKSVTPEQAQYLALLKNRGLATGKVELEDLFEPPLSILNAADVGIELFGEQGLQDIVADLNQTLFPKRAA
ncbi:MAG TPA: DEAD/DEAH box helicase family protein [Candidatus Dormibacteraeota bacterium]|nr:DEAD/DEAH box helicase family protein [Candidatus Dormibacteraeota bacterium]